MTFFFFVLESLLYGLNQSLLAYLISQDFIVAVYKILSISLSPIVGRLNCMEYLTVVMGILMDARTRSSPSNERGETLPTSRTKKQFILSANRVYISALHKFTGMRGEKL